MGDGSAPGGDDRDADDGGSGNGGGQGGQDGQGGGGSRRQEVGLVQKAVIAISVGFTLLLFAYAGWQMVTPPAADSPQVSVVGTDAYANGSVAVTVELRNPTDVGLVRATVESGCDSPPPEVQFSYVPAATTRRGTLVCPPGTTDPSATVASWVSR